MRRMRAGKWRVKTLCEYEPLHWSEVARQHRELAGYWRRPQPRVDTRWNATAFGPYIVGGCVPTDEGYCEDEHSGVEDVGGVGRCFIGEGCWCESGTEEWHERCLTPGCGLRLAARFTCMPWHNLPTGEWLSGQDGVYRRPAPTVGELAACAQAQAEPRGGGDGAERGEEQAARLRGGADTLARVRPGPRR